ncbi:hypothetical protein ACW4FQ_32130, partial [Escherichia coli]
MDFSGSSDRKHISASGQLAEMDFNFAESDSAGPVSVQLRDLSMQADKQENANGFALGPSSATIKRVTIQSASDQQIEL